jgi:hypothetical protein
VRSTGFEGYPALGVCFGPVVTSVSPISEVRGTFSWARTAFHEFTHVIHLGLSHNRCPRWITEGIATWEEENQSPNWTRNMRRELIDALANDDLLRVREMNRAFRGQRILFGYYQCGLIVRMWIEKYGFQAMVGLLQAFDAGADLDQALAQVLKTTPEAVDASSAPSRRSSSPASAVEPRWSPATLARLRHHARAQAADGRDRTQALGRRHVRARVGPVAGGPEGRRRGSPAAPRPGRAGAHRRVLPATARWRSRATTSTVRARRGSAGSSSAARTIACAWPSAGWRSKRRTWARPRSSTRPPRRRSPATPSASCRPSCRSPRCTPRPSATTSAERQGALAGLERRLRDPRRGRGLARGSRSPRASARAVRARQRGRSVRRALHLDWARRVEGANKPEEALREYGVRADRADRARRRESRPWDPKERARILGRRALLAARLARFTEALALADEALALDAECADALEAKKLKP